VIALSTKSNEARRATAGLFCRNAAGRAIAKKLPRVAAELWHRGGGLTKSEANYPQDGILTMRQDIEHPGTATT